MIITLRYHCLQEPPPPGLPTTPRPCPSPSHPLPCPSLLLSPCRRPPFTLAESHPFPLPPSTDQLSPPFTSLQSFPILLHPVAALASPPNVPLPQPPAPLPIHPSPSASLCRNFGKHCWIRPQWRAATPCESGHCRRSVIVLEPFCVSFYSPNRYSALRPKFAC